MLTNSFRLLTYTFIEYLNTNVFNRLKCHITGSNHCFTSSVASLQSETSWPMTSEIDLSSSSASWSTTPWLLRQPVLHRRRRPTSTATTPMTSQRQTTMSASAVNKTAVWRRGCSKYRRHCGDAVPSFRTGLQGGRRRWRQKDVMTSSSGTSGRGDGAGTRSAGLRRRAAEIDVRWCWDETTTSWLTSFLVVLPHQLSSNLWICNFNTQISTTQMYSTATYIDSRREINNFFPLLFFMICFSLLLFIV